MALRSLRWIVDRLIRRSAAERDLDDEIKAHLAIAAEQRIADGESPETAWSAARRELGNELLVKDATRQIWGFTSFERLWQDARYGLRTFRRSASVTVVACAALALGTGATTAIFTIVHAVLLRPLPYPDPHRLVMIWERQPTTGRNNVVSLANFRSWQERSQSFTGMAAYQRIPMNLLGSEEAVQVDGAAVTADFFRLLGVEPTAGRTFLPGEDQPASPPVAVLSHGFWLRHFGGAADASAALATPPPSAGASRSMAGIMRSSASCRRASHFPIVAFRPSSCCAVGKKTAATMPSLRGSGPEWD